MEKSVLSSLTIAAILAMPMTALAASHLLKEEIGFAYKSIKFGKDIRKDITVEVYHQSQGHGAYMGVVQNIKAQFAPELRQSGVSDSEFEALARGVVRALQRGSREARQCARGREVCLSATKR